VASKTFPWEIYSSNESVENELSDKADEKLCKIPIETQNNAMCISIKQTTCSTFLYSLISMDVGFTTPSHRGHFCTYL